MVKYSTWNRKMRTIERREKDNFRILERMGKCLEKQREKRKRVFQANTSAVCNDIDVEMIIGSEVVWEQHISFFAPLIMYTHQIVGHCRVVLNHPDANM